MKINTLSLSLYIYAYVYSFYIMLSSNLFNQELIHPSIHPSENPKYCLTNFFPKNFLPMSIPYTDHFMIHFFDWTSPPHTVYCTIRSYYLSVLNNNQPWGLWFIFVESWFIQKAFQWTDHVSLLCTQSYQMCEMIRISPHVLCLHMNRIRAAGVSGIQGGEGRARVVLDILSSQCRR